MFDAKFPNRKHNSKIFFWTLLIAKKWKKAFHLFKPFNF